MERGKVEMLIRRGVLVLNLVALAFMSHGSIQQSINRIETQAGSPLSVPAGFEVASPQRSCPKVGTGVLCPPLTPPPGWEDVR